MKRNIILGKFALICLLFIALGVLLVPSAHAVDDVTPPVLVDFSFTPTTVDVTNGPATVTFTAHITDDLSGIQQGTVFLQSPAGGGYTGWFGLLSGTTLDGVYQATVTIPQFVEEGTWTVCCLDLRDAVGNITVVHTAQLQAAGFPTQLTVQPQFVFPKTGILDNFNRANGALGSNWSGSSGKEDYRIANKQVDVRDGGPIYWKPSSFGADQEAFVKLTTVDSKAKAQGLLLKVQGNQGNWRKGAIAVLYDAKGNGGVAAVRLQTYRPGTSDWFAYPVIPVTFQNGDQFGARALANGDVLIVKNGTLVGTVSLNAADQAFFNSKGGRIGVGYLKGGVGFFDDFGGGTMTP